jgi:2-methylcitrate dehydratase PrpD
MHDHRLGVESIRSVHVVTFEPAASFDDPRPDSPLAARFSLPWSLATMIVTGTTAADAFDPRGPNAEAVGSLAERVRVTASDSMTSARPERQIAQVEVTTLSGATHRAQVNMPRGEARESPLTDAELDAKFRRLATRSLRRPSAEKLLRRLRRLSEEPDIAELQEHWMEAE